MKKLHIILKHRFFLKKIIFSFSLAKMGLFLFYVFTRIYCISDTWLSPQASLERSPSVGRLTSQPHYCLFCLGEERFGLIEVTLE